MSIYLPAILHIWRTDHRPSNYLVALAAARGWVAEQDPGATKSEQEEKVKELMALPPDYDLKAHAEMEWDNDVDGCRKTASGKDISKDIYVLARVAELRGLHRSYSNAKAGALTNG